jgi:hypothetical protein
VCVRDCSSLPNGTLERTWELGPGADAPGGGSVIASTPAPTTDESSFGFDGAKLAKPGAAPEARTTSTVPHEARVPGGERVEVMLKK